MRLFANILILAVATAAAAQSPSTVQNVRNRLSDGDSPQAGSATSSTTMAGKPMTTMAAKPKAQTTTPATPAAKPATSSAKPQAQTAKPAATAAKPMVQAPKAAPQTTKAPAQPATAAKTAKPQATAATAAKPQPKPAAPTVTAPTKSPAKAPVAKAPVKKETVAKAPVSKEAKEKPKAEEQPKEVAAAAKRDPFVSPVVERATGGGPVDCTGGKKCLVPGQLRLQGIIKTASSHIAVVVNSDNRAYFLHENDPIYNGVVTRISDDSVTFREQIKDVLGKPATREVVKKINTPA